MTKWVIIIDWKVFLAASFDLIKETVVFYMFNLDANISIYPAQKT